CRGWLAQHLPDVATEQALSTAAAAETAASDVTVAAIASDLAGELYGVPILRAGIEDNPHNSTRFLIVGRHPSGPTGHDKTSLLFAMRNEPGTLCRILEPLARLGIKLTRIESRPAKGRPWEYVIFVDLEGHRDTSPVSSVLREIGERTLFLKVLGSYPALKRRAHVNAVGIASERAHPGHRSLRAREADRGARARAHDPQSDQARVEREPAAAVRPGAEGDHRRALLARSLSGRERLLSPAGARQEARRHAGSGRARQRLERAHRAPGAHLPASRRRGGGAASVVRRLPDDRPGDRRRARHGDAEGLPPRSRRDGAGDHADDEDRLRREPEQPDRHDRHEGRG